MKVKFYFLTFSFLIFIATANAQRRLDLSQFKLVWNDEFNYTSVNELFDGPNAKWYDHPSWGYCFDTWGYCSRSPMSVSNGNLILRSLNAPSTCGGHSVTQAISEIWSKYDLDYPCTAPWGATVEGFNYGIFEIRAKLPNNYNDYSAFWLWNIYTQCGNDDGHLSCNVGPGWEIDAFEASNFNGIFNYFSTLQPNGNTIPSCKGCSTFYNFANSNPSDTYHTYTLAWSPTAITWFIDGMEVRTQTTGLVPFKLNLILSLTNQTNNSKDYVIDYVRVYRPNNTPSAVGSNGYYWTGYNDQAKNNWANSWPTYMTTQGWTNYGTGNVNSNPVYTGLFNSTQWGPTLFYTEGSILKTLNVSTSGVSSYGTTIVTNVGGNISTNDAYGQVYYKSTDNDLYVYYYYNGTWHLGLLDWQGLYPNDVASDVLYVKANSNHPDRVYYRNSNGQLCYFELCSSTGNWMRHTTNVTGVVAGSLVAANIPAGKLFYKGGDNHIYNVWKYWSSNASCNSVAVTDWSFSCLDYPYLSSNADCASDITISPDGNRIYFRSTTNELSYYEGTPSGWVKTITGIQNVGGKIRMNENDKLYYISTNSKAWNYYKRSAPAINGSDQWIASPLIELNSNPVMNQLEVTTTPPTEVLYFSQVTAPSTYQINYLKWEPNMGVVNPTCDSVGNSKINVYFRKGNGIQDQLNETENSNIIYPNPTTGMFTVINPFIEDAIIKIADQYGQIVYGPTNISSVGNAQIDLSSVKKGIYYIDISNDLSSKKSKLVIQ